jgi:hypothetical protein
MKLKNTFIAAALLLSITSAQAALVATDWQTVGDAAATLDTETGIEWLDLTQTSNASINEIEGLLGSTFNGWRLPSRAEVTGLMVNTFASASANMATAGNWLYNNAQTDNEVDTFRTFFGNVKTSSGADFSRGLYKSSPSGSGSSLMSGVDDTQSNDLVRLYSNHFLADGFEYKAASLGVFLVSDGGTTMSSKADPTLNASNENAPVNNVSSPAVLGGLLALLSWVTARRSMVAK